MLNSNGPGYETTEAPAMAMWEWLDHRTTYVSRPQYSFVYEDDGGDEEHNEIHGLLTRMNTHSDNPDHKYGWSPDAQAALDKVLAHPKVRKARGWQGKSISRVRGGMDDPDRIENSASGKGMAPKRPSDKKFKALKPLKDKAPLKPADPEPNDIGQRKKRKILRQNGHLGRAADDPDNDAIHAMYEKHRASLPSGHADHDEHNEELKKIVARARVRRERAEQKHAEKLAKHEVTKAERKAKHLKKHGKESDERESDYQEKAADWGRRIGRAPLGGSGHDKPDEAAAAEKSAKSSAHGLPREPGESPESQLTADSYASWMAGASNKITGHGAHKMIQRALHGRNQEIARKVAIAKQKHAEEHGAEHEARWEGTGKRGGSGRKNAEKAAYIPPNHPVHGTAAIAAKVNEALRNRAGDPDARKKVKIAGVSEDDVKRVMDGVDPIPARAHLAKKGLENAAKKKNYKHSWGGMASMIVASSKFRESDAESAKAARPQQTSQLTAAGAGDEGDDAVSKLHTGKDEPDYDPGHGKFGSQVSKKSTGSDPWLSRSGKKGSKSPAVAAKAREAQIRKMAQENPHLSHKEIGNRVGSPERGNVWAAQAANPGASHEEIAKHAGLVGPAPERGVRHDKKGNVIKTGVRESAAAHAKKLAKHQQAAAQAAERVRGHLDPNGGIHHRDVKAALAQRPVEAPQPAVKPARKAKITRVKLKPGFRALLRGRAPTQAPASSSAPETQAEWTLHDRLLLQEAEQVSSDELAGKSHESMVAHLTKKGFPPHIANRRARSETRKPGRETRIKQRRLNRRAKAFVGRIADNTARRNRENTPRKQWARRNPTKPASSSSSSTEPEAAPAKLDRTKLKGDPKISKAAAAFARDNPKRIYRKGRTAAPLTSKFASNDPARRSGTTLTKLMRGDVSRGHLRPEARVVDAPERRDSPESETFAALSAERERRAKALGLKKASKSTAFGQVAGELAPVTAPPRGSKGKRAPYIKDGKVKDVSLAARLMQTSPGAIERATTSRHGGPEPQMKNARGSKKPETGKASGKTMSGEVKKYVIGKGAKTMRRATSADAEQGKSRDAGTEIIKGEARRKLERGVSKPGRALTGVGTDRSYVRVKGAPSKPFDQSVKQGGGTRSSRGAPQIETGADTPVPQRTKLSGAQVDLFRSMKADLHQHFPRTRDGSTEDKQNKARHVFARELAQRISNRRHPDSLAWHDARRAKRGASGETRETKGPGKRAESEEIAHHLKLMKQSKKHRAAFGVQTSASIETADKKKLLVKHGLTGGKKLSAIAAKELYDKQHEALSSDHAFHGDHKKAKAAALDKAQQATMTRKVGHLMSKLGHHFDSSNLYHQAQSRGVRTGDEGLEGVPSYNPQKGNWSAVQRAKRAAAERQADVSDADSGHKPASGQEKMGTTGGPISRGRGATGAELRAGIKKIAAEKKAAEEAKKKKADTKFITSKTSRTARRVSRKVKGLTTMKAAAAAARAAGTMEKGERTSREASAAEAAKTSARKEAAAASRERGARKKMGDAPLFAGPKGSGGMVTKSAAKALTFGERLAAKQKAAKEKKAEKAAALERKAVERGEVWDEKTKSVKKQPGPARPFRQLRAPRPGRKAHAGAPDAGPLPLGGYAATREKDGRIRAKLVKTSGGGQKIRPDSLKTGESPGERKRVHIAGGKLVAGVPPEDTEKKGDKLAAWSERASAKLRERKHGETFDVWTKRLGKLDRQTAASEKRIADKKAAKKAAKKSRKAAKKAAKLTVESYEVDAWLYSIAAGQSSVQEAAVCFFDLSESPSVNNACRLFDAAVDQVVRNGNSVSLFERMLATA